MNTKYYDDSAVTTISDIVWTYFKCIPWLIILIVNPSHLELRDTNCHNSISTPVSINGMSIKKRKKLMNVDIGYMVK